MQKERGIYEALCNPPAADGNPLLLAISFVCFVFINLIPSNPAEVVLRIQQTPIITDEAIAEMEEALGLNKPFLVRYFDWVLGCLQGISASAMSIPPAQSPENWPAACPPRCSWRRPRL